MSLLAGRSGLWLLPLLGQTEECVAVVARACDRRGDTGNAPVERPVVCETVLQYVDLVLDTLEGAGERSAGRGQSRIASLGYARNSLAFGDWRAAILQLRLG